MSTAVINPSTIPVISNLIDFSFDNPGGISNLEVNLDAMRTASFQTTGPEGGKTLFGWHDIGGKGRDAFQNIAVSMPTIGTSFSKPGVIIDSTNDYMVVPFTYDWTNRPFTILAVGTKFGLSGFRGLIGNRFGGGSAKWFTIGQNSNDGTRMTAERNGSIFPRYLNNARNAQPQIYEFNHAPSMSTDTTYRNGNLVESVATLSSIGGLANQLRIGRWVGATQGWNGAIMQILIYSKIFTTIDRSTTTGILSPKWGTP